MNHVNPEVRAKALDESGGIEPRAHRVFLEHRADSEVLADLAHEVEVRERVGRPEREQPPGEATDADALPGDGDAMVWGRGQAGAVPPGIETVHDSAAMEVFLDSHLAGLGIPLAVHDGAKGNMRGWLGQPGLVLLLARDGVEVNREASVFAGLVPASEVEQSARKQYSDMMKDAASKNALAPDNHPEVIRLRRIAKDIIPQSFDWNPRAKEWKWEVNLVGSNQINAFCMPGGKIAFYSGILTQLQLTDDEVAMVMGHEIAHALREHARERMGKATATNGVAAIGSSPGRGGVQVTHHLCIGHLVPQRRLFKQLHIEPVRTCNTGPIRIGSALDDLEHHQCGYANRRMGPRRPPRSRWPTRRPRCWPASSTATTTPAT